MKLFWTLLLFVLFLSVDLFAQSSYEILRAGDFFNFNQLVKEERKMFLTEDDIEGSPYLTDQFIEGSVFTTAKTKFTGIPLRYNIYNDQVEFRKGEGIVQVLAAPAIIEKIEMGDFILEYSPYSVQKNIKHGFFVVLEKGNATLYSRPGIIFREAEKAEAYKEPQPPRFIRKADEYYIRVGDNPALPVDKRKDLVQILNKHEKEVGKFISENKISTNKPEALIKLVQYYNSL